MTVNAVLENISAIGNIQLIVPESYWSLERFMAVWGKNFMGCKSCLARKGKGLRQNILKLLSLVYIS